MAPTGTAPKTEVLLSHDALELSHRSTSSIVSLTLHDDLYSLEQIWRAFEQEADCTAFQAFDWLSRWQRHVGTRSDVRPVIVLGRDANGKLLFIVPLAVHPGRISNLTWLGSDLCDYNAPLLAPNLSAPVYDRFTVIWNEILQRIRAAKIPFDYVRLEKMPERIGNQRNPFLQLPTSRHPSAAYVCTLSSSWDEFYKKKRSSNRRKGDRNRSRRLAQFGAVQLHSAESPEDLRRTVTKLFEQKSSLFERMGVADLFARPGYQEFFVDLATSDQGHQLAHVSRLEVGPTWAATNLGILFRGSYYHVLCSYEWSPIAPLGPGTAHLHELMRFAIARGLQRFDLTIGDEPYKLEWADGKTHLYDHASSAGVRGWVVIAGIHIRRRLKRGIKQNPYLWQVAVKVRQLFGAGRTRSAGYHPKIKADASSSDRGVDGHRSPD